MIQDWRSERLCWGYRPMHTSSRRLRFLTAFRLGSLASTERGRSHHTYQGTPRWAHQPRDTSLGQTPQTQHPRHTIQSRAHYLRNTTHSEAHQPRETSLGHTPKAHQPSDSSVVKAPQGHRPRETTIGLPERTLMRSVQDGGGTSHTGPSPPAHRTPTKGCTEPNPAASAALR